MNTGEIQSPPRVNKLFKKKKKKSHNADAFCMFKGEMSKFPFCDHKQTTKDDKRR